MSEMMTAQELAEARELVRGVSTGPWKPSLSREHDWCIADCGEGEDGRWLVTMDGVLASELAGDAKIDAAFIAAARTLVPRLLATVDALTERAERAEASRSALFKSCLEHKHGHPELLEELIEEKHKALDAKERAERSQYGADTLAQRYMRERDEAAAELARERGYRALERDAWRARRDGKGMEACPIELCAFFQAMAEGKPLKFGMSDSDKVEAGMVWRSAWEDADDFLSPLEALADAMGRALSDLQTAIEDAISIAENTGENMLLSPWDDLDSVLKKHAEALSLTAPEALRQQQEREAEKDALIERLQNWLERFGEHSDRCDVLLLDDQGRHQACSCGFDAIAYNLTPPQALREREERVVALEKVAEASRFAIKELGRCAMGTGDMEDPNDQHIESAWIELTKSIRNLDATKGGR